MILPEQTACFTGHRPGHGGIFFLPGDASSLHLSDLTDRTILLLIRQNEIKMFLCGMADGFDLFAAQRFLHLKERGLIDSDVFLTAVQPFPYHINTIRGMHWKKIYQQVLNGAQDIWIAGREEGAHGYRARNAFLIDHSQYVIAYWNHNARTGTGQTVRMAQNAHRTIINLYDL